MGWFYIGFNGHYALAISKMRPKTIWRWTESKPYMFGLDLYAADQFCVLPVIKGKTIHWPHPKQEATINTCREGWTQKVRNNPLPDGIVWLKMEVSENRVSITIKVLQLCSSDLITFSSKVWLKGFLFLEVLEDFDNAVAFPDGISVGKIAHQSPN